MRHTTPITMVCLAGAAFTHTDALACSPAMPQFPIELELHPSGAFAQSVLPSFEIKGDLPSTSLSAELYDMSGERLPTSWFDCKQMTKVGLENQSERCSLRPESPLAPGTYTLAIHESRHSSLAEPATFTVTNERPPDGLLPAPELSWKVVAYTGLPDEPFRFELPFTCNPGWQIGDPINPRAWLKMDAQMPDGTPPGHFELRIETDDTLDAYGATFTSYGPNPKGSWTSDRFYPEFQRCVKATFVDVYGRRSETTASCTPNGCEVRDKNDRREIDWDAIEGCSDWSPGYIERNSPGCGCEQVHSPSSHPPMALLTLTLGTLGLLRRRHAHRLSSTNHSRER